MVHILMIVAYARRGNNHIANSDQDCNGDCFGKPLQMIVVYAQREIWHAENSDQDCAGICFGDGFYDACEFAMDIIYLP